MQYNGSIPDPQVAAGYHLHLRLFGIETMMNPYRKFSCFVFFVLLLCNPLGAKELKILRPESGAEVYEIAAREFQKYYEKCTGIRLAIATQPNETDDFIVIGSDAVNRFSFTCIEKNLLSRFRVRTGTDDYHLLSVQSGEDGRNFLFIAGGRGRSTLYGVYHFFELRGQCSYFWDGDITPHQQPPDISGLDLACSPRFEYRGLRYFAHRGLTRFQAEHWGPEDWEKEIDWMLKKRLNIFMLRFGMDDVFQKAFPEIVPYPENDRPLPEAIPGSFDDRTSAWSLQYRGRLRKHILQYAFDRDLMHPEDFGTMTHWYSRTPLSFLEKIQPEFIAQVNKLYTENTGLVWDIRQQKYLDLYFRLTEAHIEHYGKPELFHTIGLAERNIYSDREENFKLKLHAYRRLISKLREKYPDAPLLLAGWDFYYTWKPREVEEFLKELDPKNTILWDYTADTHKVSNFTNWGVIGKFPYVFGIFGAYESSSDIRANYELIRSQIARVGEDPFCKGYIYWPEVSHGDILLLEYFPRNAWNPDQPDPVHALRRLSRARYAEQGEAMEKIWTLFLPCTQQNEEAWNPAFFWNYARPGTMFSEKTDWENLRNKYREKLATAPELFRTLAGIPFEPERPFLQRDSLDLARSAANLLMILSLAETNESWNRWKHGRCDDPEEPGTGMERTVRLAECFRDLLALHEDYSLHASWERLKSIEPVNPCFEKTLVANVANDYCFSYHEEMFERFYLPVLRFYAAELRTSSNPDPAVLRRGYSEILERVKNTPLSEMKSEPIRTQRQYRRTLLNLADLAQEMINPG